MPYDADGGLLLLLRVVQRGFLVGLFWSLKGFRPLLMEGTKCTAGGSSDQLTRRRLHVGLMGWNDFWLPPPTLLVCPLPTSYEALH